MNLNVFVNFNGNCREAVTYYAGILNQKVPKMMTYSQAPHDGDALPSSEDADRVLYTEIKIGDNMMMFSDCPAGMEYQVGNHICLVIGSSSKEEITNIYQKLSKDGQVIMALAETFWSGLYGMVQDKFGIIWQVSLTNVKTHDTQGEAETKKGNGSGKAKHKWTKEISGIEFTGKYRDGQGIAIWKKSKELVLLKGAKLSQEPQRNKDGTLNYSAQFAEKLRLDYQEKIENNETTEDIVFPSPNQLGIFLFYGGQNTWEELKDHTGKSLDEWSRVD